MLRDTNIEFRFRVYVKEEPYLGIGRIELLENIQKFGSIAKGAGAMNMSYRKAWQLVEDMNRLADRPLVEKRLGGSNGGGACVTEEGLEVIRKYQELEKEVRQFIDHKAQEIRF